MLEEIKLCQLILTEIMSLTKKVTITMLYFSFFPTFTIYCYVIIKCFLLNIFFLYNLIKFQNKFLFSKFYQFVLICSFPHSFQGIYPQVVPFKGCFQENCIKNQFPLEIFQLIIFLNICINILTMSVQRRNLQSSQHLTKLKNKLKTVDHYIRRSQNLPDTLFMHPQVLQHLLKQKTQLQITNQIFIKNPKSFLFNQKTTASCYFNYQPIPQDKRYCLKVEPSHTHLEVFIQLDGNRKKGYLVKCQKGILINEVGWKRAQFIFKAQTKQKISIAKVQMDTITVDHKVKIRGVPSQRKIVQRQLKQYLDTHKTQQKIDEILQKRRRKSLQHIRTRNISRAQTSQTNRISNQNLQMHLYRTNSGFNQSTSLIRSITPIIEQSKIKSTQIMRDLIVFEDSKQKYIKHLQKMSPQKAKQIQKNKIQYDRHKLQTLQKLVSLTKSILFINRLHKSLVEVSRKRMKKIHIYLLCKKFIKKFLQANKTRVPLKIRNKQTIQMSLNMIACCLFSQSRKRAQQKLISRFKVELFKIDVQKIQALSAKYIETCIKVQRKFRLFNFLYRVRFEVIATKGKKYQFENDKQKEQFYKKYKKDCYRKARYLSYFFTKNHKYIDEMMKQKQEQKYKIL